MPLREKQKGMISSDKIERCKQYSILTYLLNRGLTPTSQGEHEWYFSSPFTNEHTPSFSVNRAKNVFYDFSTDQKGDVIRLVSKLENLDFAKAIAFIESQLNIIGTVPPSFSLSGQYSSLEQTHGTRNDITSIRPIQHKALKQYILSRGIPVDVAQKFCMQVHYRVNNQITGKESEFFGVGFHNDANGWAIRSSHTKRNIGPTSISTLRIAGSHSVNLFEGFFNLLSACRYYERTTFHNNTIVLNSTNNLSKCMDDLRQAQAVFCYLDNDRAGRDTLQKLQDAGCKVVDQSVLYHAHNDFNDYIRSL